MSLWIFYDHGIRLEKKIGTAVFIVDFFIKNLLVQVLIYIYIDCIFNYVIDYIKLIISIIWTLECVHCLYNFRVFYKTIFKDVLLILKN